MGLGPEPESESEDEECPECEGYMGCIAALERDNDDLRAKVLRLEQIIAQAVVEPTQSLENQALVVIQNNPNQKAKVYAKTLGVDKSTLNKMLYKNRSFTCSGTPTFTWNVV